MKNDECGTQNGPGRGVELKGDGWGITAWERGSGEQARDFFGKSGSAGQSQAVAGSPVQLRQALAGFWLRGWLCSHCATTRKASTVFVKIFFPKAGERMRRAAKAATQVLEPVKNAGKPAL
jgi:hypothetical protein